MIDKTWIHASWLICPTHLGTVASRDDMYLREYGVGRRVCDMEWFVDGVGGGGFDMVGGLEGWSCGIGVDSR